MATLVVAEQGAIVRRAGGQIVVEVEGRVVQRLPQEQVERILLLGGAGLTTACTGFALDRRIAVTYLSQDGAYKGRLEPGAPRDVALRLAQYRALENLPLRMAVARPLVEAKLGAQRAILLRAHRNHPHPALAEAARDLERIAGRLDAATTLPALMGREGDGARVYFRSLPCALRRPLPFRGRSRRPPRDPVNALLSLGYGLLTAELIGALASAGLDPQIGLFHSSRGRMPALAEDLLELFRAPVADALALSLANLGVLRAEHFQTREDGGVYLRKEALAVYFRQYRRRMQAGFRDRHGRPSCFRKELQKQAAHLRRALLEEEPYEPFIAPMGGPDRGAARSPR